MGNRYGGTVGGRNVSEYIPIVLLESEEGADLIPGQSLSLAPTYSMEQAMERAKSYANSLPTAVGFTVRVVKND